MPVLSQMLTCRLSSAQNLFCALLDPLSSIYFHIVCVSEREEDGWKKWNHLGLNGWKCGGKGREKERGGAEAEG